MLGVLGGLSESNFRNNDGKPKIGTIDSSQEIWLLRKKEKEKKEI